MVFWPRVSMCGGANRGLSLLVLQNVGHGSISLRLQPTVGTEVLQLLPLPRRCYTYPWLANGTDAVKSMGRDDFRKLA